MAYTLTKRRQMKCCHVFEAYREKLRRVKSFDGGSFEHDLRSVLSCGYREVKDIVQQLSEHPRYRGVAIYYMESFGDVLACSQFKDEMAAVCGLKSWDHTGDVEKQAARAALWEQIWDDLSV